jgi:hypothetical protein
MTDVAETFLLVLGPGKRPKHQLCRCICGAEKEVRRDHLRNGVVKSCGCMRGELGRRHFTVHGQAHSKSRIYRIWLGIHNRCTCPTNTSYPNYGARGIYVCERWSGRDGFINFVNDMGPRPSPQHSVERKENNGPYSPENCFWATRKQQGRNKRNNRLLTVGTETMPLSAWAERTGLSRSVIKARLRLGWSHERALTEAVRCR